MISFSMFSDVLPAFTRARHIGNFCLGLTILSLFPSFASYAALYTILKKSL